MALVHREQSKDMLCGGRTMALVHREQSEDVLRGIRTMARVHRELVCSTFASDLFFHVRFQHSRRWELEDGISVVTEEEVRSRYHPNLF